MLPRRPQREEATSAQGLQAFRGPTTTLLGLVGVRPKDHTGRVIDHEPQFSTDETGQPCARGPDPYGTVRAIITLAEWTC